MGKKIKLKDFQKRREQSKTFRDWKNEEIKFRQSINPFVGAVTEKDLLFERKHKKPTILDEELISCKDIREVIDVVMGRKTK